MAKICELCGYEVKQGHKGHFTNECIEALGEAVRRMSEDLTAKIAAHRIELEALKSKVAQEPAPARERP